ncbi:hypothetical protein [Nocardia sp. NBC_01009]|uniref:hypothetical protein n=1 Tax=Nocardia sp. NBC_01009 TaxID=2975996 RepID=UPI00386CB92C|nr:hypothetical protein OHA42_38585 [Nocardia sp. NBC_01009]
MSTTPRRRDQDLSGVDVEQALISGMGEPGPARNALFTEAAIAASMQAEKLAVEPYSLTFLAHCVRSLGLDDALRLPEPLIGSAPTLLVRNWMSAAYTGAVVDVARDDLFAQWLDMVAMLLGSRKKAAADAEPERNDSPDTTELS